MKVVEFYSNHNFGALYEQIDFIGECLKNGREQYIIVPDRFSLSMEKMIMNRLNLISSFDIHVVSFSRLANFVIGNDKTKKVLGMLDAVIITQYILKKHKDELKCFTNIPASTGFAKVLFDSISQLKSCKITPGMIRYSLNKQSNENLKAKMSDIALVYELYEEFIENRFIDSNNKLGLLCEKMKSSQIFENKDVHFCNFLDFTAQDYDVIKESIKCANIVSITSVVPEKNQNNKSCFMPCVDAKIYEICEELDITPQMRKSDFCLGEAQNHILNNLFSIEQDKMDLKNSQIELYTSSNKEEEILFVVKRILLLIEKGAKFGDISLICSNMQEYKDVVEQVFARYKLPFWLDQNISLEETEYHKFIKQIFDAVMFGYQTDDVLKVVQNVFSNLTTEQKEDFFVFAKKFGIVGQMWKEDFSLNNSDEKLLKFLEDKKGFLKPICEFETNLFSCHTIYDFCELAKNLIEKMNLKEKAEELSVYFENKGELKQASIFRQSPDKMEKVIDKLCEVLGEEECSLDEWIEMFSAGVTSCEIAPVPMGINSILVGQMLSTIFEPNKYYFVVGATSQDLPAFVKDVGIISDLDIENLKELNIAPTINDINKKTVFTILQNLCLWQEKLIVTMPINSQNAQNEQSKVILDLQNMFSFGGENLKAVSTEKLMTDDKVFSSKMSMLKFMLKTNFDVLEFVSKNKNNFSEKEKEMLKQLNMPEIESVLKDFSLPEKISNAQNLFFVDGHTKATEIERYFSCPFLHFVEYGLKLKELQENKIRPVDVGNILHDVCERYAKFCKGKVLDDEKIEYYAKLFFDEIMQKKEFEHLLLGAQSRALTGGLKQEAIRICKALNYHNKHSSYKTVFAEKSFGEDDFAKMPEICVYNTKKLLKMRGKVDRVDFCENKFRIVDYKTGKAKSDFKMLDLYMGKKMQLFIYLYALKNTYKDKIPTGAFYFPIHNDYLDEEPEFPYQNYCMNGVTIDSYDNLVLQDDLVNFEHSKSGIVGFSIDTKKETKEANILKMKKAANVVSQEEMNSMIEYSQKLMSVALSEILDGYICPKPTSDACIYCAAKTFCPYMNCEGEVRDKNFEVEGEKFFEEVVKNA